MGIRNAQDSIFTPTIGTGACLIMGEIVPCCPIFAVVFSYRAPLASTQIGSPALPVLCFLAIFYQSFALCGLLYPSHGSFSVASQARNTAVGLGRWHTYDLM